jgi:NitT/TauT family transport system permease protein
MAEIQRAQRNPTTSPPDDREGASGRRRKGIRRHRRLWVHFFQILFAVLVIGLWQLLTSTRVLDPFFVAQPSGIGKMLLQWVTQASVYNDLRYTMEEAGIALVLAGVSGFILGFGLARLRFLSEVFDPYIKIGNAMPRLVFAPLFLLWFGLGIWSKVALSFSLVFFVIFFNTFQGVRDVDPVLVNNVRMLGASEWDLLRRVFLPSATNWIFASLHVSVGFAIIGAVVGEYLGAQQGMGYRIAQAEGSFDTTSVFAGLVVLAIVVFIVDIAVYRLERYLLRWRPTTRGTSTEVD